MDGVLEAGPAGAVVRALVVPAELGAGVVALALVDVQAELRLLRIGTVAGAARAVVA